MSTFRNALRRLRSRGRPRGSGQGEGEEELGEETGEGGEVTMDEVTGETPEAND